MNEDEPNAEHIFCVSRLIRQARRGQVDVAGRHEVDAANNVDAGDDCPGDSAHDSDRNDLEVEHFDVQRDTPACEQHHNVQVCFE